MSHIFRHNVKYDTIEVTIETYTTYSYSGQGSYRESKAVTLTYNPSTGQYEASPTIVHNASQWGQVVDPQVSITAVRIVDN